MKIYLLLAILNFYLSYCALGQSNRMVDHNGNMVEALYLGITNFVDFSEVSPKGATPLSLQGFEFFEFNSILGCYMVIPVADKCEINFTGNDAVHIKVKYVPRPEVYASFGDSIVLLSSGKTYKSALSELCISSRYPVEFKNITLGMYKPLFSTIYITPFASNKPYPSIPIPVSKFDLPNCIDLVSLTEKYPDWNRLYISLDSWYLRNASMNEKRSFGYGFEFSIER